jgi:hypothetical protein
MMRSSMSRRSAHRHRAPTGRAGASIVLDVPEDDRARVCDVLHELVARGLALLSDDESLDGAATRRIAARLALAGRLDDEVARQGTMTVALDDVVAVRRIFAGEVDAGLGELERGARGDAVDRAQARARVTLATSLLEQVASALAGDGAAVGRDERAGRHVTAVPA